MDTDKIKIFGAKIRVDATGKLAELERAERVNRNFEKKKIYIYMHFLFFCKIKKKKKKKGK